MIESYETYRFHSIGVTCTGMSKINVFFARSDRHRCKLSMISIYDVKSDSWVTPGRHIKLLHSIKEQKLVFGFWMKHQATFKTLKDAWIVVFCSLAIFINCQCLSHRVCGWKNQFWCDETFKTKAPFILKKYYEGCSQKKWTALIGKSCGLLGLKSKIIHKLEAFCNISCWKS